MAIFHFPVVEIIRLLMKLRNNRPFLRIGRIFTLALVALAALGCASEWIRPFAPESPACTLGRVPCYQGPPLTLTGFVAQLGGSPGLLALPLILVAEALLLAFHHPRAYLIAAVFSFVSFLLSFFPGPAIQLNYDSGTGANLFIFATAALVFLSWPLAFDEQLRLNPNWDFRKNLPWFMYS